MRCRLPRSLLSNFVPALEAFGMVSFMVLAPFVNHPVQSCGTKFAAFFDQPLASVALGKSTIEMNFGLMRFDAVERYRAPV